MTQNFSKALLLVTFAHQASAINIKENLPTKELSTAVAGLSQDTQEISQTNGLSQISCESGDCPHYFKFWCEQSVWHDLWNSVYQTLPLCQDQEEEPYPLCQCNPLVYDGDEDDTYCVPELPDDTTYPPETYPFFNFYIPLAQSIVAIFDSHCGFDNRLNKEEARSFFYFALLKSKSVYCEWEFENFWFGATNQSNPDYWYIDWKSLASYLWDSCFD